MALPACRVFAGSVAAGRRPIEHQLDAAAQPGGRLGLFPPQRLDDLEDERGVDIGDGERAEDREGVLLKRVAPLALADRAFPAGFVRLDVGLGGVREGDEPCLGKVCGGAFRLPQGERVEAVEELPAGGEGFFAGGGERDEVERAEPHPPLAAVAFVA